MNWLEYVQTIEAYDVDVQAVEKYNDACSLYGQNAERSEFLQRGYDPDLVNEFCFYPIEEWGTLIQWAVNEYDETDVGIDYKGRLLRAGLICAGLDPEIVNYVQNPTSSNVLHDGQTLMDVYHLWTRDHNAAIPFEQMRFGFNSFSGAITVIPPECNQMPQDDESNWIPMDEGTVSDSVDLSGLVTPDFDEIENQIEKARREKREKEERELQEMMEYQSLKDEEEYQERMQEEWNAQWEQFQQLHGDHYDEY